jgi:transcriptional regulator with XRE-family HTH domain
VSVGGHSSGEPSRSTDHVHRLVSRNRSLRCSLSCVRSVVGKRRGHRELVRSFEKIIVQISPVATAVGASILPGWVFSSSARCLTDRAYTGIASMLYSLYMRTLGKFIVERRKELGMSGREVVAEVRNSDGKPISIPFLVDLEHDRRKPSDEVLEQFAKVLKVDSDMLYFLAGRFPADLTAQSVDSVEELAAAWKAFRREVKRRKKP